jgi:hypothetical protein
MTRPTTIAIVLAPLATLAVIAVSMSPIAMTIAVMALGVAIAWDVEGPDLSYLDRPAPEKIVIGRPIRRPLPIRFLPPVVDVEPIARTIDVRIATVEDEITRLLCCYHRAVASRHRTRAAAYAARIGALQSSAANART